MPQNQIQCGLCLVIIVHCSITALEQSERSVVYVVEYDNGTHVTSIVINRLVYVHGGVSWFHTKCFCTYVAHRVQSDLIVHILQNYKVYHVNTYN